MKKLVILFIQHKNYINYQIYNNQEKTKQMFRIH